MSIGDSWWQIQKGGLSKSMWLSPVLGTASQPRYHPTKPSGIANTYEEIYTLYGRTKKFAQYENFIDFEKFKKTVHNPPVLKNNSRGWAREGKGYRKTKNF